MASLAVTHACCLQTCGAWRVKRSGQLFHIRKAQCSCEVSRVGVDTIIWVLTMGGISVEVCLCQRQSSVLFN